ncbi:MAG: RNA-binding protein [Pseudomonadota bacterium]
MSRGGRQKTRDVPERRCIASGVSGPTTGLIRFVVGPDDAVVPDLAQKLPGRGIWVAADRESLAKAAEQGLFSRAARAKVSVPDGLVERVETGLLRRVTDLISMARKAGQGVAGYEKVKGWLEMGEAALLFQASDGSERGKTKLRAPEGENTYFDVLTASELGLSFGRERVIHAALAAGGLADRIRDDVTRLSGVREHGGGTSAGKAKEDA